MSSICNTPWSNWSICGRATLGIATNFQTVSDNYSGICTLQPFGISFHCKRNATCIEYDVYQIFMNAIKDKSKDGFDVDPLCSHGQVTGGCGNKRGYMWECRCPGLDRKANSHVREAYENKVILKIMEIVKSQNVGDFHIKLAVFCSGGLLGEEILLFKLFEQLRRQNAAGKIELFFIDGCYANSIKASSVFHQAIAFNQNLPTTIENLLGGGKYIEQFLIEISKCVQPSLEISGTFFDHSDKYIEVAKSNPDFMHHLLIGSDIEDSVEDMSRINQETRLNQEPPIALVKNNLNKPLLCELNLDGNLDNCYVPAAQTALQPQCKKPPRSNENCSMM